MRFAAAFTIACLLAVPAEAEAQGFQCEGTKCLLNIAHGLGAACADASEAIRWPFVSIGYVVPAASTEAEIRAALEKGMAAAGFDLSDSASAKVLEQVQAEVMALDLAALGFEPGDLVQLVVPLDWSEALGWLAMERGAFVELTEPVHRAIALDATGSVAPEALWCPGIGDASLAPEDMRGLWHVAWIGPASDAVPFDIPASFACIFEPGDPWQLDQVMVLLDGAGRGFYVSRLPNGTFVQAMRWNLEDALLQGVVWFDLGSHLGTATIIREVRPEGILLEEITALSADRRQQLLRPCSSSLDTEALLDWAAGQATGSEQEVVDWRSLP